MLKTVAISDTHGLLPQLNQADVGFICGDISPLDIQFNKPKMTEWLHEEFCPWIRKSPVDKFFMVAGNHDAWFEGASHTQIYELEYVTARKLVYLENEFTKYIDDWGVEWTIFGTPYCKIFGNWPFMRSESYMIEKFKDIPDKVDFILSHDTPYGVGQQDLILQKVRHSNNELEHIGNKPLYERIKDVDFRWMFHGHIHSASHEPDNVDNIANRYVVNVSIVDEYYTSTFEPFYLEHNKE